MTTPERIVFAAGDIFGGGGAALISVLYLFYLTDVIGIAPGYAGLALLIPKIRITAGFTLAFRTDNFGNLPFTMTLYDLVNSDDFYTTFLPFGQAMLSAAK